MNTYQIFVENIKCMGCVNSIKNTLLQLKVVTSVEVFQKEKKVCVSGIAFDQDSITQHLFLLGYPEKYKNNLISKSKSFLLCKVSNYKTN